MPPVPPLPIPAAAMPPPKLEPQPQSGPSKRLLPYLPLTAAAATAASDALATLDPSLVERLVSDARFTARSRGAVSVTARDFAAAYESVDVLLSPTSPTTAFAFGAKADPLAMYLNDVCTIPSNLAGHPAISVPFGQYPSLVWV